VKHCKKQFETNFIEEKKRRKIEEKSGILESDLPDKVRNRKKWIWEFANNYW